MPKSPPPRDADGNVLPHDHPEILNSEHVIRHTKPQDVVPDSEPGKKRLGSGAYSESSDGGMSVDHEEWLIADHLTALNYVTDLRDGATRLTVGELRALGFQVGWDPLPENPHHCAVWGIGNGSKRKKRIHKIGKTVRKAEGED
jgi:hypothetical protein